MRCYLQSIIEVLWFNVDLKTSWLLRSSQDQATVVFVVDNDDDDDDDDDDSWFQKLKNASKNIYATFTEKIKIWLPQLVYQIVPL